MQKESKAQMEEQGEVVLALALTSSGLRVSLASAIYGTGRAQPLVILPLQSHPVRSFASRLVLAQRPRFSFSIVRTNFYSPEVCTLDESPGVPCLDFLVRDPLFVHTPSRGAGGYVPHPQSHHPSR